MADEEQLAEQDLISFNGVNGSTGEYLFPAVTSKGVAKVAQGKGLEPEDTVYISAFKDRKDPHYGLIDAQASKLNEAGWGIVISTEMANRQEILAALDPLLQHREQRIMSGRFKKFSYIKHKDASPIDWLARNGAAAGSVDPKVVPYYLLLIGSPEDIPFRFQFTLDVQYAVGRIHFETVAEYAIYAKQVVERETLNKPVNKQVVLFGVKNDTDQATDYSIKYFIDPLHEKLQDKHSSPTGSWLIECIKEQHASKSKLTSLLKQDAPPALLLTASHGMGFPVGDMRQTTDQGAVLCSDWPGIDNWAQPIPNEFYFSANDLSPSFNLNGMMLCLFACYSGGVPNKDHFNTTLDKQPAVISPADTLSLLPKQLLLAGASAVIAHIDRAWATSFLGELNTDNTNVFKGVIDMLLAGLPVGHAMSYLNDYYANMESAMSHILDQLREDPFANFSDKKIAKTYIGKVDARNYILIGDPATRLSIGQVPI